VSRVVSQSQHKLDQLIDVSGWLLLHGTRKVNGRFPRGSRVDGRCGRGELNQAGRCEETLSEDGKSSCGVSKPGNQACGGALTEPSQGSELQRPHPILRKPQNVRPMTAPMVRASTVFTAVQPSQRPVRTEEQLPIGDRDDIRGDVRTHIALLSLAPRSSSLACR
jgi:hypothetical protein